jgi:hypothetical protein
VLAKALYPHARIIYPLIAWIRSDYRAADLEFISGVGRLTRWQDFPVEVKDYVNHPGNVGFGRRGLRLRVSARRLHRLVKVTFRETRTEIAWPNAISWPSPNPAPVEKSM